jgi:hypothetical protein
MSKENIGSTFLGYCHAYTSYFAYPFGILKFLQNRKNERSVSLNVDLSSYTPSESQTMFSRRLVVSGRWGTVQVVQDD